MFKRLSTQEFIEKAKSIHGDKYNYSKVEYKNAREKVIIICPKHGEFLQYTNHHLAGRGCRKCANKIINVNNGRQLTQEQFIEKIKSFNLPNISFEKTVYKTKRDNVIVTCSIHGEYKTKAEVLLKGCGCPKCKSSNGEKFIKDYLKKNNIVFETQKQFKNLKYSRTLRFDFYLPEYNCCIEYDGEQHTKKYRFEKNNEKLKIRILRDNIKNEYCKNNNIKLIRFNLTNIKDIEKIIK